jgi:hypothetical protein
VAEVLPLSESELQLLESLIRHQVRFLVVGLSAAALHGAPVVTEDVDLWFEDLHDPKFLRALREVGAGYVPPFGNNPPMLAGRNSEPFDVVISMSGLRPFADEFNRAVEIPVGRLRLKVLPLDRIVVSKTAANRPKDRLVLPVLRNALHTLQVAESAAPKKRPPKRPKPKRKRRKRL